MAARAATGDLEGNYRHIWAIFAILEDYFAFGGMHYQGPKKAFQHLERNDKKALDLFSEAISNTKDIDTLNQLIDYVISRK